jgi:hypothetical protein
VERSAYRRSCGELFGDLGAKIIVEGHCLDALEMAFGQSMELVVTE